jgi:hypothetical protein
MNHFGEHMTFLSYEQSDESPEMDEYCDCDNCNCNEIYCVIVKDHDGFSTTYGPFISPVVADEWIEKWIAGKKELYSTEEYQLARLADHTFSIMPLHNPFKETE